MFSKPGIGKPYLPLCGTRFVAKGFAISREMACYPGGRRCARSLHSAQQSLINAVGQLDVLTHGGLAFANYATSTTGFSHPHKFLP